MYPKEPKEKLVGCFGLNGHLRQYFSLYRAVSKREREIWLIGCFGFNGPLRQYFSLYRAVSQREGERGDFGWLVVLGLTAL